MGKMLSLPAYCVSHYFLKPGFPFLCLPFIFPPFIAGHIVYGIDGKVDMGMGIFSGKMVNPINHLAMVFLVKIIGHFSRNSINIQTAAEYERFGFRGKVKEFMVNIPAKIPFPGMHLLDGKELADDASGTEEFHNPYSAVCQQVAVRFFASAQGIFYDVFHCRRIGIVALSCIVDKISCR